MIIQWEEINEVGERITRNHPYVSVANAHTYAKSNHRKCNGKGLEEWDNGWRYEAETDDNGNQQIKRYQINPRISLCDCAIRTIEKAGL